MDIQDTTKGATKMIDRYRRVQRQVQEEPGGGEGGFTLIELLIVIVVLGILAAVTVFGLSNVTGQSLTSACHADAKSVAVAVEAYRAQNPNNYPATITNTAAVQGDLTGTDITGKVTGTRYLRSTPGNTNKYGITLGPVAGPTDGSVLVWSRSTGSAPNASGVWSGGTPVDFEHIPAGGTDPCTGL